MENFRTKLLIYLGALSVGTLLISNLVAMKLWDFFGVAVDGGVVVFPLTYILGDLIVEFYGKKTAKDIVFAGFLVNILAVFVFYLVILLPVYEGWELQDAFSSVLGFTPRIIFGSLVAYVCSNLLNNYVFTKFKEGSGVLSKSFIARALSSSTLAHMIDCAIFETIAFVGVLPFKEFLAQAILAYFLGMGLELILAPIEAIVAKKVGGMLDERV